MRVVVTRGRAAERYHREPEESGGAVSCPTTTQHDGWKVVSREGAETEGYTPCTFCFGERENSRKQVCPFCETEAACLPNHLVECEEVPDSLDSERGPRRNPQDGAAARRCN